MSRIGFSKNKVLLNSVISSTYTSAAQLASDYATISLSLETVNTSSSLWTVQGSNEDGYGASLRAGGFSNLTTIVAQGMYTIDAGPRWVRVLRSSLESLGTVTLQGWAS